MQIASTTIPLRRSIDRRRLIAGAVALGSTGGLAAEPVPARTSSPLTCADFLDVLGVNTHLNYDRSPYADLSRVTAAIDLLGVRHVRDAVLDSTVASGLRYAALAARGLRFCMLTSPHRAIDETLARIAAFQAAHPGAVEAIEGPNEIKPAFSYGGRLGTEAGVQFMSDLRAGAEPRGLRTTPLVAFTGYGRAASDCDVANVHLYPRTGGQPGTLFDAVWSRWSGPGGVMRGKPVMVTEMGFHTLLGPPARDGQWRGVDEETQAILLLNCWAAAAARVERLYVYELLDGGVDSPDGPNQQTHFGLFRTDGTPKAAAIAIGAVVRRLRAPAPRGGGAAPPSDLRIDASPPLSWLTLRAQDGADIILFRNEGAVWDPASDAPRQTPPGIATVNLAGAATATAWDMISDRPYTVFRRAGAVAVSIGRRPVALRIG